MHKNANFTLKIRIIVNLTYIYNILRPLILLSLLPIMVLKHCRSATSIFSFAGQF